MKGSLTLDQIERKVQLLSEFLETFAKIDSGFSKWKGILLVQLSKMSIFLADQHLRRHQITQQDFLSTLVKCVKNLEMAGKCLQHEEEGTEAAAYYTTAKQTLCQASDILHFSKIMK